MRPNNSTSNRLEGVVMMIVSFILFSEGNRFRLPSGLCYLNCKLLLLKTRMRRVGIILFFGLRSIYDQVTFVLPQHMHAFSTFKYPLFIGCHYILALTQLLALDQNPKKK